ncbi:MAG: tRNA-specific 2-thiouridylase MnmA [Candidatus Poribacteria bacterium]|nr:MAG: tRNA-specific 2-thiouridylase MnmA [Candidatus Poribacteria bacterium]
MPKRVVVAMSGGVDSSVVAALLVEAGYEVIGITMRLGSHDSVVPEVGKPTCCGIEGIMDARRVAAQLGIPFYPVNYETLFAKKVVDYFTEEYRRGRTPNPCVLCNQELKFGQLLLLAEELEADAVATGHYARIVQEQGRYQLLRGKDRRKDQSYFLFSMTQEQLARTLFPLGDYTKDQVREIARNLGLWTAEKPESQEICFIPDNNYRRFLAERAPEVRRPGKIVDRQGHVLGEHPGTAFFTVGQRRGLGIASHEPLYVVEIRPEENLLVVGTREELLRKDCLLENVNWLSIPEPSEPIPARVQIRYRDPGGEATVEPLPDGRARVHFHEPRGAITPGQAAVFYDGDLVLGGGWIAR